MEVVYYSKVYEIYRQADRSRMPVETPKEKFAFCRDLVQADETDPTPLGFRLSQARLRVLSAREWTLPQGMPLGPRKVPNDQWICIRSGKGTIRTAPSAEEETVEPGAIIFIPLGTEYCLTPAAADRFVYISVHFRLEISGNVSVAALSGMRGPAGPASRSEVADISYCAAREWANLGIGRDEALEGLVFYGFLCLLRDPKLRRNPGLLSEKPKDVTIVQRLLPLFSWVEERLADGEISVSDMARVLHVSEVHLRSLFRAALRKSPGEFLRQARITRACDLLSHTERTVSQIAFDVGFSDPAFFHRQFRKLTGMTPTAYRRRALL